MKWIVALVLSPYPHREIVKYDNQGNLQSQIFWAFSTINALEMIAELNEEHLPVEWFPHYTAPR